MGLRVEAITYHSRDGLPHSDYTVSYHQLMRHLAKNFDQKSILRVVKSLAAFRPSLIALL